MSEVERVRVKLHYVTVLLSRSRDVYHTKRMQRLTTVAWSLDNKYVLSGSDEMCIRLWKARASERIGIMRDRERVALQYNEKLKEKYGQHPQIAR